MRHDEDQFLADFLAELVLDFVENPYKLIKFFEVLKQFFFVWFG